MIRFALSLCRRAATALAVVAALAFVIDGALGGSHLVPAASAHVGHHHGHAHGYAHADSHAAPAAASDHRLVDGDGLARADVAAPQVAAHQPESSPASGTDADANGCTCACACCAAALQPSMNAQAAPFLVARNIAVAHRRHGDGIVPEGLRKPPRPLSIA